jgi:hypothetical protein
MSGAFVPIKITVVLFRNIKHLLWTHAAPKSSAVILNMKFRAAKPIEMAVLPFKGRFYVIWMLRTALWNLRPPAGKLGM